jgi:hypothetical protein
MINHNPNQNQLLCVIPVNKYKQELKPKMELR